MRRDFSEGAKQALLSRISEVGQEPFSNANSWMGAQDQAWIARIGLRGCIYHNVDNYYRVLSDKNNASKAAIETVFQDVVALDSDFQGKYAMLKSALKSCDDYIVQMERIIHPNNGNFTAEYITETLNTDFSLPIKSEGLQIFDGSKGYGGDQGDMSYNHNGVKILWWVLGEDEELYEFVRTQNGYENYSDAQIHDLINQINEEGCGYVALVNALFAEFNGSKKVFEDIFGFPMFDKNGNYNYNKMLIDIYCRTDDKYFLTKDSGKIGLVSAIYSDFEDKPEKFEELYGIKYDVNLKDLNEIIDPVLSCFEGDVATYKQTGTTIYAQENRLLGYLDDKGINADVECSASSSLCTEELIQAINSGRIIKISLAKGAQLCDASGKEQKTLDGSHAVIITGVADDGRYIISSWGKEYYVDPSQIYTDSDTGKSASIINHFLSINITYKWGDF